MIDTIAALLIVIEQSGRLENLNMPGGGRPCVLEHIRDFARGHGSTSKIQREQNPAPGGMRKRAKHRLVGVHPSLRLATLLASRHAGSYLARKLIVVHRYLASRLIKLGVRMRGESEVRVWGESGGKSEWRV